MTDRSKLEHATAYVRDLPGFKKTNPHYFKDPMVDRLMDVVLMMGAEIWTLRHRQAITEQLLAANGRASPDMIETFRPDMAFRERMEQERQELIKRMFASLSGGEFSDPKSAGFEWVTERDKKEE